MKYPTVFNLIADVFKKMRVRCVLVGGVAVNQYCPPRHTGDIDFIISEEDYDKVLPELEKRGFRECVRQHLFARLQGNKSNPFDIDFLFVDSRTFDGIFKGARKVTMRGAMFLVPSSEHLVALKLHSIKHNVKRELPDLLDITNLIRAVKMNVKTEHFRQLCLTYGTKELYEKIVKAV